MRCLPGIHIVAGLILIIAASPCLSAEQSPSAQSSKYLNAVRELAGNEPNTNIALDQMGM